MSLPTDADPTEIVDPAPPAQPAGRCFGDGDPLYERYHDEEWGVPVHGEEALFERIALEGFQSGLSWITVLRKRDAFRAAFAGFDPQVVGEEALFERIALEGFQSGLSWITVLRKRDAFRAAFAGFDPAVVAGYDEHDVERLMQDAGIVRNRQKIEATVANARALLALHESGRTLDALFWSFAPDRTQHVRATTWADVPAVTPQSRALARELKSLGFRFVGPTTAYAAMQACGLVDDHLATCPAAHRGVPDSGGLAG